MSHSTEPWTNETGSNNPGDCWSAVYGANRELVLYDSCNDHELEQVVAEHARIVACVNACAGIPTEALVAMRGNEDILIAMLREIGGYTITDNHE